MYCINSKIVILINLLNLVTTTNYYYNVTQNKNCIYLNNLDPFFFFRQLSKAFSLALHHQQVLK